MGMTTLYVLGYTTVEYMTKEGMLNMSDFFNNKDTEIALFLGYSDEEISNSEAFNMLEIVNKNDNSSIKTDISLKLKSVNTGYGKSISYIPNGYKSISLFEGSIEDIKLLKDTLPKIYTWSSNKINSYRLIKDISRERNKKLLKV